MWDSLPVTAYESEDQLLWTPEVLSPSDVEKFLLLAQRRWGQGRHVDAMATDIVKDNEQVRTSTGVFIQSSLNV